MPLLGAALVGMMRAAVPPQAAPEAGIAVPRTATTNMGLDTEARRLMQQTVQQRLAEATLQQSLFTDEFVPGQPRASAATEQVRRPAEGAGPEQIAEVKEASQIARADRPHRITRQEALDPTGLGAQEAQLIQAHYRDQALFSPAARALLLRPRTERGMV